MGPGILRDPGVWLAEHHSTRKALQGVVIAGAVALLTQFVAMQTAVIAAAPPEYAVAVVLLFAGVNGVLNYVKHLNDNPEFSLVKKE